jgi:hypothetical protein
MNIFLPARVKASSEMQHRKRLAFYRAPSAYQAVPTSFNKIWVTQDRVILDAA